MVGWMTLHRNQGAQIIRKSAEEFVDRFVRVELACVPGIRLEVVPGLREAHSSDAAALGRALNSAVFLSVCLPLHVSMYVNIQVCWYRYPSEPSMTPLIYHSPL